MANENGTQREQVDPTLIIVGAGNKNGAALMQQGVASDPLPQKVGGMNVIKVDGINGKGEHKEYGANPMTQRVDLVEATSQIAKAVVVGKASIDAKRYVFKDPEVPNATLHMVYDVRNTDEPLAIFRKKLVDAADGKKEMVTEKLRDKEIVLVPKGDFAKEDLGKILKGLVNTLNGKTIDTDSSARIVAELKKQNLLAPKKVSEIFAFIRVFDENLAKTEENTKALKMALMVDQDIAVPKGGLENLSSVYNPMTLNGISIASMQNAADIARFINGEVEHEDALSAAEKAFIAFAAEKELTAVELVEAETIFGVDASGNVVVVEDGNVPYASGGQIHETELKNRIAEASKAKETLDAAFWDKANKLNPEKYPRQEGGKEYSDAEIAQAEKTLQAEAEKFVKHLGENAEKGLNEVLAKQDPMITMLTSGDIEAMQKAQNAARDLMAVVRAGATKQALKENPLALVRDGYFKDGRQLGQANSSPKKPLHADYKKGERVVKVMADIPKLIKTVGDDADAVVNLKTTKMPVLEVLLDKNGKALDVSPINTFGAWSKQQKLGRVLKAIMDIKGDDEHLDKKLKNLVNYGGKINDEATNFGLGAVLQDEENLVAQYFKGVISEIRQLAYPDGQEKFDETTLEAIQGKIADLVNSEDYSVQNLGKQVVALQEKSANLEDYFDRAGIRTLRGRAADKEEKRQQLKDVMLRVLNGEEVLPTKGATLSIAKTAEVVKAFIDPIRTGANEVAMKVATDMAFKHDDFKRGKMIHKSQNGDFYIRSGYYNENIIPAKKENIDTIIGKALSADAGIDIEAAKAKMETLQAYYDENKEVFVRKSSLYSEDEEIEAGEGISVDLDAELAQALGELSPKSETPNKTEEPTQEDMAAEQEESGVMTPDEIADATVSVDASMIDPSLFGDEIDPEEDTETKQAQEADAIQQAQSVQVDL